MIKRTLPFLMLALIFSSLSACSKSGCDNAEKAKIVDLNGLDGCGFLIELQNGDQLEVMNWADFENEPKDQEKIWVVYKEREGASICMVGKIVELTCIEKR